MQLHSQSKVPDNYYEMALNDAMKLFDFQKGELISIKVRPLAELPTDNEKLLPAYVYPQEYKNILKSLETKELVNESFVSGDKARKYSIGNNEAFVIVEHETGPEVIVYLALLTASLSLAKSVFDLITTIIKSINDSNERKKKGESTGRFYEAKAISIEKRTKKGGKVIKIIQLPSKGNDFSIDELKKLLNDL